MTALVLSGSYTETNRFARQHGLGYGIRHVVSASNLEGRRPTSIHILPSYYDRRDIHAVKAAMKHVFRRVGKNVPVVDYILEDGVYTPKQEASAPEQSAADEGAPSPTFVGDESKDAVPGQIPIEEAIGAAENEGLPPLPEPVVEPPAAVDDDLPDWLK